MHRRAAAASAWCIDTLDEFGAFECFQVLANCGVGESELGRQFWRGGALRALQALDDAALGTGEVAAEVRDTAQSNGYFASASLRKSPVAVRG